MIASASLTAALAAIDALDISPEDKDEMSKGIAEKFANDTSDVTDDAAIGAMPPDMATAYKAPETSKEDKERNLSAAKRMYKAGIVAVLLSNRGKVTANSKEKPAAPAPVAGVTQEQLSTAMKKNNETLLDMLETKGLVTLGAKPATVNGQGERVTGKEEKKDWYTEHVQPLVAAGVKKPEALSAARRKDAKGFAAWQASKHPAAGN